jgi:hypothetical protein
MKAWGKALVVTAVVVLVAAVLTCQLGVQREIDAIPEATRTRMVDFDWVGVQWIERGMWVGVAGLVIGAVGMVLLLKQRRKNIGSARASRSNA